MSAMRKMLSMLLLALCGLPFAAPLLAGMQTGDSSLPACCRRGGAHHCAAGMQEAYGAPAGRASAHLPRERCPFAPAAITALRNERLAAGCALPLPVQWNGAGLRVVRSTRRKHTRRKHSAHKRGPPRPPKEDSSGGERPTLLLV